MISHAIPAPVLDTLLPKPFVTTEEWTERNLILSDESKVIGPFRWDLFPHAREPMEAFDNPKISRVVLQWASQLGKTNFAMGCTLKAGHYLNRPMLWADADEKSARRVAGRIWGTMAASSPFQGLLPPPPQRALDDIKIKIFRIHIAWAGSPATVADYGAWVAVINECDKMKESSTSKEAFFPLLVESRLKGIHGAKLLVISTPSMENDSFIEACRLEGDNRSRQVPCPFCNAFQELRTGDGRQPGGIKFEKRDGELDAELARLTAYYECEKCLRRIEDSHRYSMFNSGIWLPEGCKIENGKVTGTPARAGRIASFGPLPELHSLLPDTNFGTYAEKYVLSLKDRHRRRDFINSSEARTFNPRPSVITREQLMERMGLEGRLCFAPHWTLFLTAGVDVGRIQDELYFIAWTSAWGLGGRGHLVDLWIAQSRDEFINRYKKERYPIDGTSLLMRPVVWCIDSGSFTGEIYKLVKLLPGCWAIKGSSHDAKDPFYHGEFQAGEYYRPGVQRIGLNRLEIQLKELRGDYDLILPNTGRTQERVEDMLSGLIKRDAPDWYSLPSDAIEEPLPVGDVLRHLLGDYRDGNRWLKRYDDQHLRDAFRYSFVAAQLHTLNGTRWNHLAPLSPAHVVRPAISHSDSHDFEPDHEDDRPSFVARR